MTLPIYTRRQWGAKYDDGFGNRALPYEGFVLHHSAGTYLGPDTHLENEISSVRTLEGIGQSRFGGGISYPWVVPGSGRVFEGLSPHRRGAHTKGLNTSHSAIVLPGDFRYRRLTPQQEEAIAQLMVREKRLGHARHARILLGHQEAPGASTSCPGTHGMDAIPRINARAAAIEDGADPLPITASEEDALVETLVRGIQNALVDAGFDPGEVDGVWGPNTQGAFSDALAGSPPGAQFSEGTASFLRAFAAARPADARGTSLWHGLTKYRRDRDYFRNVAP